ncbi:MAG: ABC transporter ATP-binding protein [Burkholderiales bacterium]|nr:ABC transporter ATP-binding protein [Burkholderiales bacterium]
METNISEIQGLSSIAESPPAFELEDVSVCFAGANRRQVLNGINLRVPRGEFIAIVGKSGCGKTTILNLLVGLLTPTSGAVKINGKVAIESRHHVGYMVARDCLFPWRRVLQNVTLPLEVRGVNSTERNELARKALEKVALGQCLELFPRQLSHGMRQRVALARTWALNPDILLMDEPFAALDALTRLDLEREFLGLVSERKSTVLLVTHDLAEALAMADRVLVLSEGAITLEQKVPFERPRDPESIMTDTRFPALFKRLRDALHSREIRSSTA